MTSPRTDLSVYTTASGVEIERKQLVRDLGVHISDAFTWTPHINIMLDTARRVASWVLGVFKDRSKDVMLQLYKSLIRSRLEYCCPLWDPTSVRDIEEIEQVQRHFTRRIAGMSSKNYWERLSTLKLQSLQRRRERYMIIHTWKIINGKVPNDINLEINDHKRLGTRLVLPKLSRDASRAALTAYDNSFAVRAVKLWNLLPKHVQVHGRIQNITIRVPKEDRR